MRSLPRFWTNLFTKLGFTQKKRCPTNKLGFNRKLCFEQCEDRRVLATFLVTDAGDGEVNGPGDQPGTLRQAVFDPQVSLEANDIILFDSDLSGDPIMLTAGAIYISDSLTIKGEDPNGNPLDITIDGGDGTDDEPGTFDGTSVFSISSFSSDFDVTFESLTIAGPRCREQIEVFDLAA